MSKKNIIIIKKIKGHGGHHGGAWKVAYADFVTAMMSLFIVLWLLNTSEHIRKAVAGYFNDPLGRYRTNGAEASGKGNSVPAANSNIEQLKNRLEQAIKQAKDFNALSKQIEMTVTPEGLRIELLESNNETFFDSGSAQLNGNGREILSALAKQLGSVPNHLSISGYTDAKPYSESSSYGNWELSADRANAARRLMDDTGLRSDQVSQVRGYADQQLRLPAKPFDPSNRRISLIVQYVQGQPQPPPISPALAKEVPTPTAAAPPSPGAPTAPPAKAAKLSPPAPPASLAKRLLSKLHGK